MSQPSVLTSPAELVAIANAAHRCGDRSLKSAAVRELKSQFGITITFGRTKPADELRSRSVQTAGR